MTVVFAIAAPEFVILGADAAVTLEFASRREYETGRKLYVRNAAMVTTWGARDGNNIHELLRRDIPNVNTIRDLADQVFNYLKNEYAPKERRLGNVGYHIGGFDPDGSSHLYHVFWEPEGYLPTTPIGGLYELQDQSPTPGRTQIFLYNGRHDLAHKMVTALLDQVKEGRPTRFDFRQFADSWRFVHFVLRFAAELTPEVGPPFVIAASTCGAGPIRHIYESLDIMSNELAESVAAELRIAAPLHNKRCC